MALDFTKLHDAIGKVADLAKSHASVSVAYNTVKIASDTQLADAQKQVDDLVEQLLAAVGSPAEVHGLAAVADVLSVAPAPGVTVAPVAPVVPVTVSQPVVAPAPVAPAVTPAAAVAQAAARATPVRSPFLPGDPRAAK